MIKLSAGITLVPALWLRTRLCFAVRLYHRILIQISIHRFGDNLACMISREQTNLSIRTIISTSIHSLDMDILNTSSMFWERPMWITPIIFNNRIIVNTFRIKQSKKIKTKSKSELDKVKINGSKTLSNSLIYLLVMKINKSTHRKSYNLKIKGKISQLRF